jgi:hypothetical protein
MRWRFFHVVSRCSRALRAAFVETGGSAGLVGTRIGLPHSLIGLPQASRSGEVGLMKRSPLNAFGRMGDSNMACKQPMVAGVKDVIG